MLKKHRDNQQGIALKMQLFVPTIATSKTAFIYFLQAHLHIVLFKTQNPEVSYPPDLIAPKYNKLNKALLTLLGNI